MPKTIAPARSLRSHIANSPMTAYQWLVVACAVLLNANDGFDVAAMSFVSVNVENEFGLSGSVLGTVISATLVGMSIGAIFIGRLADAIGRRWTLVASTAISTLGMFLASSAQNVVQLGIWRVVTGLGVGGILAGVTVVVAEFSSTRWRGLAIGIYSAGYGIGAFLGGIAANSLQENLGWRSVFFVGASASVVILVAVIAIMPESVQFLVTKRPAYADKALGRIATRVHFDPAKATLAAHPVQTSEKAAKTGFLDLFKGAALRPTLLLWAVFLTIMFAFYFVNSWTPRLMIEAGMTTEQGVYIGMALAVGGAVGSVLFGIVAAKVSVERVLLIFVLISAVSIVAFVFSTAVLAVAMTLGVFVGLVVNGCVAGAYAVAPTRYEAAVRGTGVGVTLAVGRLAAIFAPIFGGAMLDMGLSVVVLYSVAAVVLVVGAVGLVGLSKVPRSEETA
ncbi:MFS transporter [Galactobacter sp.]|uniref:MFS transporter n=1 Tax=Galactobacter sp. TaxID=2676125 RepID=UPI0025BA4CD6|nr:MFS transporter [Galactobacter sp.]